MADSPNFKNGVYESVIEVDDTGKYLSLTSESGKLRTISNTTPQNPIDFVLMEDGRIMFGNNHSFISDGNPVRYAGEISISRNSGKVTSWNNNSGHYLPNENDLEGLEMAKNSLQSKFPNMDFSNFTTTNY